MALSRIVRLLWSSQTIEKVMRISTTEDNDSPSVNTHYWKDECYICARHTRSCLQRNDPRRQRRNQGESYSDGRLARRSQHVIVRTFLLWKLNDMLSVLSSFRELIEIHQRRRLGRMKSKWDENPSRVNRSTLTKVGKSENALHWVSLAMAAERFQTHNYWGEERVAFANWVWRSETKRHRLGCGITYTDKFTLCRT